MKLVGLGTLGKLVSVAALATATAGTATFAYQTVSAQTATSAAGAAVPVESTSGGLTKGNTVNLQALASAVIPNIASQGRPLTPPVAINRQAPNRSATTSGTAPATSSVSVSTAGTATPGALGAAAATPAPTSFPGLTGAQQSAANSAYDLEPPDQGLSADNQFVIEPINNALAIYRTNGQLALPATPLSAVFGVASESTGNFTSDPRCYYDSQTGHWFLTELDILGASSSEQLLAVSDTSNPLGAFTDFSFATTDSADTGCPCFGDYPMIGADSNGFYITTNEFPISGPGFNGAQLYAVSKVELELAAEGLGSTPVLKHLSNLPDAFDPADLHDHTTYHLSPALSPPGALKVAEPNNGTELFTMSDPIDVGSSAIAPYALENTKSLSTAAPALSLAYTLVGTQAYQFPATGMAVRQAAAPVNDTPLRAYLERNLLGPQPVPAGVLQADFDAVQQTTWAGGNLYTELSSASTPTNPIGTTSAEWFEFSPGFTSLGALYASVVNQGNISAAPGGSLLYPALAVNAVGIGEMVVGSVGAGLYPSMVTFPVSVSGPDPSAATVVAAGSAPEDGFTCYAYYVGPTYGGCRWGDYSFAVVAPDGLVWTAAEWIPPASYRDFSTNWGTYISSNATAVIAIAPAVTAISPTSGRKAGGTSVMITGTGFTGATAVAFGATAAKSFTVNSDTSITAVSPKEVSGTVSVRVTTPEGTSATGLADEFTYTTK